MKQVSLPMMQVSLPMYDWPQIQWANDALWQTIKLGFEHGLDDPGRGLINQLPQTLSREREIDRLWRSPNLLLSQTCGLPYIRRLHKDVLVLGAMSYNLDRCQDGTYHSVLISHKKGIKHLSEITANTCLAINAQDSQSGCNALYSVLMKEGKAYDNLSPPVITGSHQRSIQLVAKGKADLASIDCVTFAIAQQYEPAANEVVIIGKTIPTPGLPIITGKQFQNHVPQLQSGLQRAVDSLPSSVKETLFLKSFIAMENSVYDVIHQQDQDIINWKQNQVPDLSPQ